MAKGKVARIDVGGIFVLRWKTSSMLFMKFHIREEDVVHVHGCTGAASYVDKEITRNEARDYWKGLVADGWAQCHDMKVVPRDWWFWN